MTDLIKDLGLAELFAATIFALVAMLVAQATKFISAFSERSKGALDEEARLRLEAALKNAVAKASDKATGLTLQQVIDYVQTMNPGDLARLKLGGRKLEERAEAAIAVHGGAPFTLGADPVTVTGIPHVVGPE